MSGGTAAIIIAIIILTLGALCFAVVVLTNTVVKLTRLGLARNPIEAARAESILKGTPKPPIEQGYSPAEMP